MTKPNQPIRKPTLDVMKPRRHGEQGWQLNLREQLLEQAPPRHLLDLREPAPDKDEKFFEYMPVDGFAGRATPDMAEAGWDELDIDEKLAAWWGRAVETGRRWPGRTAAMVFSAWAWFRLHLPSRRPMGVALAVALLAGLAAFVAASESTQHIASQGVKAPPQPGRGGVIGALPQTGAGDWLAILENYLDKNYRKLSPETKAQPSPLPAASAAAPASGSGGTVTVPTGGGSLTAPPTGVTQPVTQPVQNVPAPVSSPAPLPLPLAPVSPITQPLTQPVQDLTQPVQQLTQPVTGGLGL